MSDSLGRGVTVEADRTRAAAHGPPALDQGAIGNRRVLALVSPTSTIEWLCLPTLGSPSIFGRLLDTERGRTLLIRSRASETRGRLACFPSTNVP